MSTIADKLSAMSRKQAKIEETKNNLKTKLESKGVDVGDAPFSEYPAKIDEIEQADWMPNPTWWDIETILENDTQEGFEDAGKAIYLLPDNEVSTALSNASAYKTSDGAFYDTATATHTWDVSKDKPCDEGYKTRWVIAYYAEGEMTAIQSFTNSLYVIVENTEIRVGYAFGDFFLVQSYTFNNSPFYNGTGIFSQNRKLNSIKGLDTKNCTSFVQFFIECTNLSKMPEFDYSNATSIYLFNQNCVCWVEIPAIDVTAIQERNPNIDPNNKYNNTTLNNSNAVVFGGKIGSKWYSDYSGWRYLNRRSLLNILNGLGEVDGVTLVLGEAHLAKLTDEEKAIATNKGWTLA